MIVKHLKYILFFTIVVTYSLQGSAQKPYNILWLSCEDIGPIISAYGTNGIETPNIDRLAQEGILFSKAYATVGVCAPSRSSIITGMYPISIGAHNMRTGDHWAFHAPEDEHYQTSIKVKDKTGRNVPQYSVVPPVEVRCFTEYLRAAGYFCTNNAKCDYQFNCPITAWDEVGNDAHYQHRPKEQPFFAVFNHGITHESQIWKRQSEPLTVDTNVIRIPDYYANIPIVRRDVGRKYSNIEALDAQIGEWLQKLEEEDLLDRTIIFFWSDHGGPLLRQKRAVGNSGLRVPLIVRFPDKRQAGTVVNDIVSLIDLGPTVLSLAGIQPPDYMHGKAFLGAYKAENGHQYAFGSADRFDEHTQMSRSVLDGHYVYIRNYLLDQPYTYPLYYREQIEMTRELIALNQRGLLNGDASYIFRQSLPREELYDLKHDPDEVHNLTNHPAYKDKLEELRNALCHWQLEMNDKGFIPEHDLVNLMWPNGIQPQTETVQFSTNNQHVSLTCATPGASIAYQKDDNIGTNLWELYSEPIKITKGKIAARAVRIGYQTSAINEIIVH
ncbi:sulfatase-like hydrolase/transferase [Carboxylicivirga sediminis]|uniref:Sulfatase-like hydrolase/transferase n=1 Tax=Carboxylicivirga sediminis TaxID=2006564 RepID=A0A941F3X1_9BACT|nr:sulfatase-like hydrolase/transferase [Carboxylicivirga sediminis]MBR8536373.1 sulfatase-like hydrolase/transferase [Carboxylicivirga sediminis]